MTSDFTDRTSGFEHSCPSPLILPANSGPFSALTALLLLDISRYDFVGALSAPKMTSDFTDRTSGFED
jgi:hypothetical protein